MLAEASQHALTTLLRTQTQAAHHALDSMPILVEMASGRIGPGRYLLVIAAFDQVWRVTEPEAWTVLAAKIPEISILREERCRLLDDDLAALGGRKPGRQRADATAAILTPPQAAGALYVFEGARLGGRLIAERLGKAGHPLGSPGYRFFGDLRDDVAIRWRQFRGLVDAVPWTTTECACASAAARTTFAAIADALHAELADV